MNADLPPTPREELEAQLTALLLGELPADQAFALGRTIEQDPELAKLYIRLKESIGFVRETVVGEAEQLAAQATPLQLSASRREKLLAQFKVVKPSPFNQPQPQTKHWVIRIAAAGALIFLVISISIPKLSNSRNTFGGRIQQSAREYAVSHNVADNDQTVRESRAPQQHTTLSSPGDESVARGRNKIAMTNGDAGDPPWIGVLEKPTPPYAKKGSHIASTDGNRNAAPRVPIALPQIAGDEATSSAEQLTHQKDAQTSVGRPLAGSTPPIELTGVTTILETKRLLASAPIAPDANAAGTTVASGPSAGGGRSGGLSQPTQVAEQSVFRRRYGLENGRTEIVPGQPEAPAAVPQPASTAASAGLPLTLSREPDAKSDLSAKEPKTLPELTQAFSASTKENLSDSSLGAVAKAKLKTEVPSESPDRATFFRLTTSEVETLAKTEKAPTLGDLALLGKDSLDGFKAEELIGGKKNDALMSDGRQLYEAGRVDDVEAKRDSSENRALGFDWYLGNQLGPKGSEAAQSKTTVDQQSKQPLVAFDSDAVKDAPGKLYSLNGVGYVNVTNVSGAYFGAPPDQSVERSTRPILQFEPGVSGVDKLSESAFSFQMGRARSFSEQPKVSEGLKETTLSKEDSNKRRLLEAGKIPTAAVEDTIGKSEKIQEYDEAKQKLEQLQRFQQMLNLKMASEKTDVDLPKTRMVDLVDKAQPADQSPGLFEKLRRTMSGGVHSTARVKIERDQTDISGLTERPLGGNYDPYFMQTEYEVIQSDLILGKVAEELHLSEVWAKKRGEGAKLSKAETLSLLKKKLDLKPVRNTSLIEIGAKGDTPQEAANIANAVAKAYSDHRLEQRLAMNDGGIVALENRFKQNKQEIQAAQKKVDILGAHINNPGPYAQTNSLSGTNTEQDPAQKKTATPSPIPQPEVATDANPYSTFSLNVSDVSFKLAAASLDKGQMPEPASIRSEEFINAFDYHDPEPAAGAPVAFAWERARYPFAHNRDLLRFSIKTAAAGRQAGRALNIVLLLDNSGSMERADRVSIIREALKVLASQLQPQDKLSVVTFSRTPRLWVDGIAGDKAGSVADELSGVTPQGGTNLEEAMNLAYQTAARHYLPSGINRVVLLTDGAANLGDVTPESLKQKVEAQRKQGIALDCFGIGWEGFNDDLLEVMSRNGDGRYGFINTPEEAATEFAGQLAGALQVAASDVKVQVEFNSKRVTAYRQIGYAKHQLTKEQFRDNTVDAAEIGAAESGNALYVIEVNQAGEGPLGIVRVRFKIPGTSDYREHEWPVPFNGNAASLEQSSPAMRLSASASAFSEWLVSSPYAAEVTLDRLLGYLSGVPDVYGADARPKKLEWMIRQAKGVAGK